jgi:hypothetical protein
LAVVTAAARGAPSRAGVWTPIPRLLGRAHQSDDHERNRRLATVLAVIVPFKTSAALSAKVATAAVALVIGIAIGTLLSGAAARSVRRPAPGGGYAPLPPDAEL